METIQILFSVVHGLARIFSFLFFTFWGWGIVSLLLLFLIFKQGISGDGSWRWSVFLFNLSEKISLLFLSLPQVLMGFLFLFLLAFFEKDILILSENLKLTREKELLTQTLKNLRFEGKLLDLSVETITNGYKLIFFYYTHSPWQNKPILRHKETLFTSEKRIYIDFGICNFEYSAISEGIAYNLAFPARLYTETIPPERGYSLFSGEKGLIWNFDIPEEELVGIESRDFQVIGKRIVEAITNNTTAKKLGIRTFYGQAIAIDLVPGRTYQFVSTGSGGVKLLP
ncbi:MAG: hypothetical protein ACK4HQ_01210 [Brevinematales bacterium]